MLGPVMPTARGLHHGAKRHQGLGLIELLIGVTVLGVLMAVAVPSLNNLIERRRVAAVASELSSMFNYAKTESGVIGDRVLLHLEPDPRGQMSCAVVSLNGPYDPCRCYNPPAQVCGGFPERSLRLFQLPKSDNVSFEATASQWNPNTSAYVIGFARNGKPNVVRGLALTVTGRTTNAQLRVEYNDAGRIRVCSPNHSVSGYPTC